MGVQAFTDTGPQEGLEALLAERVASWLRYAPHCRAMLASQVEHVIGADGHARIIVFAHGARGEDQSVLATVSYRPKLMSEGGR